MSSDDVKRIGVELGPDEFEPRKEMRPAPPPPPEESSSKGARPEGVTPELEKFVKSAMESLLQPIRKKQSDIHALLIGEIGDDGEVRGGLDKSIRDLNDHITSIKQTGEDTYRLLTNEMLSVRDKNRRLELRLNEVEAEVSILNVKLAEKANGDIST